MTHIKNIIFDLGGIFIDIDYAATREAFINLGLTDIDKLYQQDFVSDLFENLEIGAISEDDFYDGLRKTSQLSLTNHQIETAWNKMLGSFWGKRLQLAKQLKENHQVFLLSNTNIIHYKAFQNVFSLQFPENSLESHFHQAYYSHQMGLRKPNAECYLKIIQDHQLNISETLFIDDTLKNIEGAKLIDLITFHFTNDLDFEEELHKLLNFQH